jgi:hypothetical protein
MIAYQFIAKIEYIGTDTSKDGRNDAVLSSIMIF